MGTVKYIFFFLSFFLFSFASSSCLFAQERAVPKSGEGIDAFLLRHNRSPKRYRADFIKLNQKKLGKSNALKLGVSYLIPPVKKNTPLGETVTEPLFGKALSKVKVTSDRLKGACFYVVSGHGGPDPGAIGKVGRHVLHEDEYAYDIALRLARNLIQEGAKVHIIIRDAKDGIRDNAYLSNSKRETCMGEPIPLNQVERLQQRCDKINALYPKDKKEYKYCRAIFIHVDSRSKRHQTDVFFYHSGMMPESRKLADTMKDMFEAKYDRHQPNRGFRGTVSSRKLYVLTHSAPASVYVELGNIQNEFDRRRLVYSSNRQALAKWLMEGFVQDYSSTK